MSRSLHVVAIEKSCRNSASVFPYISSVSKQSSLHLSFIFVVMTPVEGTVSSRDELTWIEMGEPSFREKAKSKGLSVYLVPIGCAATVGVLAAGLYNLYKRDSLKQQMCMRYRVLAQGITVAIAMFTMFQVPKENSLEPRRT